MKTCASKGLLFQIQKKKGEKNVVEDAPINGPFVQRDRGAFLAPAPLRIDVLQSELVRLALEEALCNPLGTVATCCVVIDISGRGIVLLKHV